MKQKLHVQGVCDVCIPLFPSLKIIRGCFQRVMANSRAPTATPPSMRKTRRQHAAKAAAVEPDQAAAAAANGAKAAAEEAARETSAAALADCSADSGNASNASSQDPTISEQVHCYHVLFLASFV